MNTVATIKRGPKPLMRREVKRLLVRGWNEAEIAQELGISPRAVRYHKLNIRLEDERTPK